MLRIGFVGAGNQGRKHIMNCYRLRKKYPLELVAVCDTSKSQIAKFRKLGLQGYTDFSELITKEKLDAIIISLPNYLHEEYCIMAAQAGINVLVEKPLACNAKEGLRILHEVEKHGTVCMIGMSWRFNEGIKRLKESLDKGVLGETDFAQVMMFNNGPFNGRRVPKWYLDAEKAGGGVLIDTGIHAIDLLQYLLGEVKEVSGYLGSQYDLDIEDYAEVHMEFTNGARGIAIASWRCKTPFYRVDVLGQWARSTYLDPFDIAGKGILHVAGNFLWKTLNRRIRGIPFMPLFNDTLYNEMEYFIGCLASGQKPKPDVRDAVKTLNVIDMIYSQAKRVRSHGS